LTHKFSSNLGWSSRQRSRRCRIETNELQEGERFPETDGLDTLFQEHSELLDHRIAFETNDLMSGMTITFFNVWLYNCIMNRPFVFINVAMTADGKIDTFQRRGSSISSPRDKERVDRLRAGADAVMVGGRTLLNENPKLTVKSEALRAERVARGLSPNPVKVGVVTQAHIREDSQFLNTGPANIVIFTTRRTSKRHLSLLTARGVDVYLDESKQVDLQKALATLKDLGVDRLMVEGGGSLNFELMRLGLVDEVTAYIAPMIFGGESAPTLAAGSGLERSQALPLKLIDVEKWEDGGVLVKYQFMR
jgi:2,5-diamino-6-(ribosylamino)-4(3H)-pyrimidinone 5'-phosphate reductase